MASPFQKISFYVAMIIIIGTITTSLFIFSNDLANSPNDLVVLDAKSLETISEYEGFYNSSGYQALAGVNRDTYSSDSIIATGNTSGVPQTDGFLATVQYAQTFIVKLISMVYLVYNAPIFLLQLLGLQITAFSAVANIVSGAIFLGIVVLFIKLMNISSGD